MDQTTPGSAVMNFAYRPVSGVQYGTLAQYRMIGLYQKRRQVVCLNRHAAARRG
jgi:hypothetical protein